MLNPRLLKNFSISGPKSIIKYTKAPENYFTKDGKTYKLNNKCQSGENLMFYPILNVPKSKDKINYRKKQKQILKKRSKFKSDQIAVNHRYNKNYMDENESCKDLNFVSTPPEEENRGRLLISPFSDIIEKDLSVYMNPSPINEGILNSDRITNKFPIRSKHRLTVLPESPTTPPPFSIYSKIIKRRRLRKL